MPRRQVFPGERLVTISLAVRADQKAALEALAVAEQDSVSHECRRAFDEYLARLGRLPVRVPVVATA
jgi:hypothetical protein